MQTAIASAFPLQWPEGWPRAESRRTAAYRVKLAKARDDLLRELRLMGAESVVVSSNAPPRADNTPVTNAPRSPQGDPGVAVYFYRNDQRQVIACDQWDRLGDNLRACGLTISALRMIDRTGASDLLDRAFNGFKALPAHKSWWEIFGFTHDGPPISELKKRYRHRAAELHPDKGGTAEAMAEINEAYTAGLSALGGNRE